LKVEGEKIFLEPNEEYYGQFDLLVKDIEKTGDKNFAIGVVFENKDSFGPRIPFKYTKCVEEDWGLEEETEEEVKEDNSMTYVIGGIMGVVGLVIAGMFFV
jgi:hypothetical protein